MSRGDMPEEIVAYDNRTWMHTPRSNGTLYVRSDKDGRELIDALKEMLLITRNDPMVQEAFYIAQEKMGITRKQITQKVIENAAAAIAKYDTQERMK